MKTINFTKVFSNDVELDSPSLALLRDMASEVNRRDGNSPASYDGIWHGSMATLRGTMTTGVENNNTVVGYAPTESVPFEIVIFDGYRFRWHGDSVSTFQHLLIEK